jgi:thiol-disulfide isomerase/thioredoxin
MNTKYFAAILLINALAFISLLSCENDSNNQSTYPAGELSWEKWQTVSGWDDHSASDYTPNTDYINAIKSISEDRDLSYIVFTASWCPDSRSETPKMFKLFSELDIPLSSVRLFGVDREKKEPTRTYLDYDLQKVPTMIVLEDGEEIGRIVEYPIKTWEEDLLDILNE